VRRQSGYVRPSDHAEGRRGRAVPAVSRHNGAGGKATTLTSSRWSIDVETTKANQRFTLPPVLKTRDWLKPASTKLSVKLKTDSNVRCPLGWCEPMPIPRDQSR